MSTMSHSVHESRDQEAAELLTRAYEQGDAAEASRLREQVVVRNRGLALALARRFEGRGIESEDLEQVAMLGLVLAARRYRPDRGHGFTAFAVPTINGELKRYFRDHGWAVRPPRGLQELHHDVRDAIGHLRQEKQREVDDVEVAEELGVDVEAVRDARAAGERYRSSSLDVPVGAESSMPLADTLSSDEDPYTRSVTLISLRAAMKDLDARERRIISLRFGADLTQKEIGERIGVSQMQVSRILTSICTRLRTRIEA